jgi:histidine triad (HIT) family protein
LIRCLVPQHSKVSAEISMAFVGPVVASVRRLRTVSSSAVRFQSSFLPVQHKRLLSRAVCREPHPRFAMSTTSSEADIAKRTSELRGPEGIFSRIVSKEIPADILYEDDECVAFRDINPQAPKHIVVIPRRRIAMLSDAKESDAMLLGKLMLAAAEAARIENLDAGYRILSKFVHLLLVAVVREGDRPNVGHLAFWN